jgi:ABC-type Zn uptake system ZnuABC Zn-binding protein ZnuA
MFFSISIIQLIHPKIQTSTFSLNVLYLSISNFQSFRIFHLRLAQDSNKIKKHENSTLPPASFLCPARELLIATIYPIYYPLLYLAGELYDVKVLISTRTDVHHYEPKPQDLRNLKEAKHIFTLGLESWERKLPVPKERLYLLNQNLPLIGNDPHIWMSPRSYQVVVDNLYKALLKIDPKNQNIYERRYREFSKRLKDLDEKYRQSLANAKTDGLYPPIYP